MCGDGTVDMCDNMLRVNLPKSIKSISTLLRFDDLIPGSFYFRLGRGTSEAEGVWSIYGETARSFSEMIAPHCIIKGPQFALAATTIIGRTPHILVKDGVSKRYENTAAVVEVVGASRYILENRLRMGNDRCTLNGYDITLVDRDEITENRKYIYNRLQEMKKEEHAQIIGPLSYASIAGFVDAEGTFQLHGPHNLMIKIPQKSPAILQAINKQYPGCLYLSKQTNVWCLNVVKEATRLIEDLLPFLYEKRAQVDMILTSTTRHWKEVKVKLDDMKGVCVRVGRLKTINTKEQLDDFINTYFERQGKTLVRKRS